MDSWQEEEVEEGVVVELVGDYRASSVAFYAWKTSSSAVRESHQSRRHVLPHDLGYTWRGHCWCLLSETAGLYVEQKTWQRTDSDSAT